MQNNKKSRLLHLAKIYLIVGVLILLYLYLNSKKIIYIPCIFHSITKLYCPGCGMTRAILSFLHFDIIGCLKNNILFLLFLPIVLYLFIKETSYYLKKEKFISIDMILPKWLLLVVLVITLLFGFTRNFKIFSFLQPL